MSEQVSTQVSTQLLVPADVWRDKSTRQAALVKIGRELAQLGAKYRENIDHENATVSPYGLKATVARIDVGNSQPTAFVGYDLSSVDDADLVMIVVSAAVVPS